MSRIIVNPGTEAAWEIPLPTGTTRLGRSAGDHQIQIDHPSVSATHCELVVGDVGVLFRDLGSSNGSFLQGQPVSETYLQAGQGLRIGDVHLRYESGCGTQPATRRANSAEFASGVDVPAGRIQCRTHPTTPASSFCVQCRKGYCPLCVSQRGGDLYCRTCGQVCTPVEVPPVEPEADEPFHRLIPGCFAYPFKGSGIWMMLTGSVIFVVVEWVSRFSPIVWVALVGYSTLYAQGIIHSSALGDDDGPAWPSADTGLWGGIWTACWQVLLTFILVFAPLILVAVLLTGAGVGSGVLIPALLVLGYLYLPMALLTVGMFDSVTAINPMLVVPSILRIPGAYALALLVLGIITAIKFGLLTLFRMWIPLPLVPDAITSLFAFYFLTVNMRVLGLMYYSNRHRLAWFT